MTDNTTVSPDDIKPISIIDEMKRSYLDYAMSVIVSRALPDVRDGLKPVHRRILFSMSENNYTSDKPHRKSARVVGDVIGKYHPHGDQSVYDALVRMTQDFSLRVPLIDGQGNFGSVDGDSPAAMRYTEVRLKKVANALIDDLDKDTVDYQENYDGSESEPVVLPARFPNLLVNGAGGIAVGMATNIPPHNLGEILTATMALIANKDISDEELLEIVPGPDFPTGAFIMGRGGARNASLTGRGSILMRGKAEIEERGNARSIIINEIPYQVNKASMIEKIAELVKEKKIEGISEVRDESDRDGMRVVIDLKRDAVGDVVLNQLYRYTPLQCSFSANYVTLNHGRPMIMSLRAILEAFIDFREVVVTRRTRFLLNKARDRAHILVGLAMAIANIDEVIRIIRTSASPAAAREALVSRDWPAADIAPLVALIDDPRYKLIEGDRCKFSDVQAQAILDLRLQRLTAMGREEIDAEMKTIAAQIAGYLQLLASREEMNALIVSELEAIKTAYATPRRSIFQAFDDDLDDEDLIVREDMVVTFSHAGYVKRVPLAMYRAQRRGGKGRSGMNTRDEDFVTRLFVANTHTAVLFFTSNGKVFKEKVWRLPIGSPQMRGKALINMLQLAEGERITSILPLPDEAARVDNMNLMFATKTGQARRNALEDFLNVNRAGKIAMKLDEGDEIVDVALCTANDDVMLTTQNGQAIRFPVDDVRVFKGRDSTGVRGVNLAAGDAVMSMAILNHMAATSEERVAYLKQSSAIRRAADGEIAEDLNTLVDDAEEMAGEATLSPEQYANMSAAEQFILTISENGYGKRTSSFEYRITSRGGKGITAIVVNERNGKVAASFPVEDSDQILLVTDGGQLIRCPVAQIRVAGRSTQGVTIFNTAADEKVVSVERVSDDGGEEEGSEEGAE